jgi:hypothetical protein
MLLIIRKQQQIKEKEKIIKRNYFMLKRGAGGDDDKDKDYWRNLSENLKNKTNETSNTTVEDEEENALPEQEVTKESMSDDLNVENLTEETNQLLNATNDLEFDINANVDTMHEQQINLSNNTNDAIEHPFTLNEHMLQNLTEKTQYIMANYIELTNKVDILIKNSNRSILNDLYTFFVNLITNWNYIMIGGGIFIIVIAGIGSFMFFKGNRGNYVQVSPLLTEQSHILTQQTMSLIAQSQAVSNAGLNLFKDFIKKV